MSANKKRGEGRALIIVKRNAPHHAAHHGGAWKVAYADFVTAMMAFFMVMWILGMDQNLRQSIEGYFANPVGYKKGYSAGKSPLSSGSSPGSVQSTPLKLLSRQAEERKMDETKTRIHDRLAKTGLDSAGGLVDIVRTPTGLRIELAEGTKGDVFFGFASAAMTPAMRRILEIVAQELAPLKNPIIVEGHTDAAQYAGLYTNWELSADRANAARRVLERGGVDPDRVLAVKGLADRQLRDPDHPLDPRNRRISIVLPFVTEVDSL